MCIANRQACDLHDNTRLLLLRKVVSKSYDSRPKIIFQHRLVENHHDEVQMVRTIQASDDVKLSGMVRYVELTGVSSGHAFHTISPIVVQERLGSWTNQLRDLGSSLDYCMPSVTLKHRDSWQMKAVIANAGSKPV